MQRTERVADLPATDAQPKPKRMCSEEEKEKHLERTKQVLASTELDVLRERVNKLEKKRDEERQQAMSFQNVSGNTQLLAHYTGLPSAASFNT